ncbi:MAG: hypothetical protein JJE45_04600 [Prolixibacteraceae bacterium]|nr:hypothetical protein [Prolixibacteraceae bacterium]
MEESIFKKFPVPDVIMADSVNVDNSVLQVNGHFHTPYSFSAFSEIRQAFDMAEREKVEVLGINDFYTMDGYREFSEWAEIYKIFPLYNIEFMALQKDLQRKGIRVNDPNNPGRTYFSGKGLKYPVTLSGSVLERLQNVQKGSNSQTREMLGKLNDFLKELKVDISFSFDEVKNKYARNLLRERHIAKALREKITEVFSEEEDQKSFYFKLFSGKAVNSSMKDEVGLENEIRSNLLKSGGKAFVAEDDQAFLSLEQVIEIIIKAGGIPCYPVLLDNSKGEYTDYESDFDQLYKNLISKKIYSLELIPGRNHPEILEKFVNFFNKKGFVITFGTEHNTPRLDPVTVLDGNKKQLSDEMKKISYEGACVIAAHQYLVSKGEKGYLKKNGRARVEERNYYINLGNIVIKHFIAEG